MLGDADRLRRVLHNLVGNALRATQSGGEVVIEVVPEGDRVRLSVLDSGVGMSPEVQSRVFDRFFRAERTPDGTGLGLAIVRQLVEQHEGTIELVSAPGAGAAFHLRFRRAVAAPAAG
ncbi:MAG: sensor histidine kinase [Candidatus Sericytochromatia bacterium]